MPKLSDLILKNISTKQTLVKNSFWLVSGKFLAGLFRALIVIVSARLLGASAYGSFSLAMSFVLIFSFLPEFGLSTILTRELAKKKNDYETFSLISTITLGFSFISYLIIFLADRFFIKDPVALSIVPLLGLMMIVDVLREYGYGVFQAQERMEIQGGLHLLTNFLIFGLGFIALRQIRSPFSLSIAYFISVSIGFGLGLFFLKAFLKNYRPRFNLEKTKQIFMSALPIALSNFLLLLLIFIDSIILGWFHSPRLVGLYTSSVKISQFLILFPQSIALAVFPMMSKSIHEKEKLKETTELGLKLSIILMLPLTFGIFILASKIILLIFGPAYFASIPALRIIIFSLLGTFPFLLLSNLLIALDKRKELLIFDLILVVINVGLNLLLIPKFDLLAASYNTTLVNLLGFVFAHAVSQRYVNFDFWPFLPKPLLATAGMSLFLISLKSFSLLILLPGAVIVYLLGLYLVKEEITVKIIQGLKRQ